MLDTLTFSQHIKPSVPVDINVDLPPISVPLYCQNLSRFQKLLEVSLSLHAEIKPAQIFVVTADPYRTVEPANSAGFPTALLRRAGGLESRVNVEPTLAVDGLLNLCAELEASSFGSRPRVVSRPARPIQPFRVCGLYQVTQSLGSGSFGTSIPSLLLAIYTDAHVNPGDVFGAFNVFTDEEVAIKIEMPTGKPNKPCVLPYEAQVYRQLRGHQGIPSLRWYGMDGGAHVIVLDKLGATLQQLRRVCRRSTLF